MTYKLITEDELRQAIRAIESDIDAYGRTDDMESALATLRAVMEREGPEYAGSSFGVSVYTLPDEDKK